MIDLSTREIRNIISELNCDFGKKIDLNNLTMDNNIRLVEKALGCDTHGKPILGACKSQGLKNLIVISPSIISYTRKRFTIAHEIGHLFLHHGIFHCIETDFYIWRDKLLKESQANTFAAELLLPYQEVIAGLKYIDVCFELADTFAERFEISLTATTIRLIKADQGMSAVIFHDGRRIFWIVNSPSWVGNLKRDYVNPLSLFRVTNSSNRTVHDNVDPAYWLNGDVQDWECSEETRFFPSIRKYLTILNILEP